MANYQDGKTLKSTVPRTAYSELGFRMDMTIDEARLRAKSINALSTSERQKAHTVRQIALRVEEDSLSHSIFFPAEINDKFVEWIDDNVASKKARAHWAAVKKMLLVLKLEPENYAYNKKRLYKYLAAQEYSMDYSTKLLRILNHFGQFMCRFTGKYYDKVPAPRGHDREMINDAYLDSPTYFGPSEALSPTLLQEIQADLIPGQYRWLYCSIWFGLRPSELDQIAEDRQQKHWRIEHGETDVLWVYQPKLTSKPRPKRWKPIPILFNEQKEALSYLLEGHLDKPLTKTIKRYTEDQITLYGGRKGFVDLMMDRGQKLEDISQWLGHTTIEMTWKKYKDRTKVHFTKMG